MTRGSAWPKRPRERLYDAVGWVMGAAAFVALAPYCRAVEGPRRGWWRR